MKAQQLKEELYNRIYNLAPFNPDPEIMERATQNTALYIVELLIFEREVLSRTIQIPGESIWNEVKQEILKDKALWNH